MDCCHKNTPEGAAVYTCPMHPEITSDKLSLCPECGMNLVPSKAEDVSHSRGDAAKAYTCPMHPEVISGKPGLCPDCGMSLVPVTGNKKHDHGSKGFNKHAGHSTNIFKTKFWVSFILSIPVVAYSDAAQTLLKYSAPKFPGSEYLQLALSSVIFFYGGSIFVTSAYRELRAKLPGMMTLIALAVLTAYIYSIYSVFSGAKDNLFWELSTLITIMLLGHWLEMRAVSGARNALSEISKLMPDKAEVIRQMANGEAQMATEIIPLSELKKGDIVLVKPGARIPADGVVKEGVSDVDESVITGESKPVPKKKGDDVVAGAINGDGSLQVTVTKIGDETFLAGVMRLVADAESSKSRLQMLSDRAAYWLTIVAVVAGGVTFASWLAVSSAAFAISRMVAVLVVACPHALGLAIPLVASISTTKAARNGFLVKQRMALEAARNIDTVLFDKTGTLTKGEFGVQKILAASGSDENEVLKYAASANAHSEHPLAKAMLGEAKKRNIGLFEIKSSQRLPGKGVRAEMNGADVLVGSMALAEEKEAKADEKMRADIDTLARRGETLNAVIVGGKLIGVLALADVIREESREAVKALREMGVRTAMVTGDDEDVAKWVASEIGMDEYFAKVLPEEKAGKVKLLQKEGRKVAMVGDGVNDAPALAQADIGIAIGAGTNVAIESAGIILVKNDPRDIPKIIRLSQMTYSKMLQNLFWAAGYNVIAVPLAAGVLASKGIMMEPAFAAVLMSMSTVIVAFNAVLLRGRKL